MFQCPKCKNAEGYSSLSIYSNARVTLEVAEDESVEDYTVGDLEYESNSIAYCRQCEWEGTVQDITVEATKEEEKEEVES